MRVARVVPHSFRNLADAAIDLGPGLTVLHGPNGAGKTNVLEALFFALTGRSCRTRREREMIAFGGELARVEALLEPDDGRASRPARDAGVDLERRGAAAARRRLARRSPATTAAARRSRSSCPTGWRSSRARRRRAAPTSTASSGALWPARAELPREYSRALAQRNSLLARIKRGGDPEALVGLGPRAGRAGRAAGRGARGRRRRAGGAVRAGRRPSSGSPAAPRSPTGRGPRDLDADGIVAELAERRDGDVARGFTGFGPHRDEVELSFGGRSLRRYGSQGQQRLGLLALLFAEREALRAARRQLPLLLLDDVMSELDPERRARLVAMLEDGGQALITATEIDHVPATRRRRAGDRGGRRDRRGAAR